MELWELIAGGRHVEANALHERLLLLWNAIVGDSLPYCIKYVQEQQGLRALHARAPMHAPSAAQKQRIDTALATFGIGTRAAA